MNWQELRADFPVTQKWAFFDHAAVAPLSKSTARAIAEYAEDMSLNGVCSFHRWADRIADARRVCASLVNAQPIDVAFVPNTSTGIGLVAEGFPWQPGDNVVTAAEEYPANQYPWMNLRDRGVETRTVASTGNRILIDDIRNAIDAHTRVVSLSSVEFASGFRNDLAALGEICRSRGIFFFVDAIQSIGALPLDVEQLPIDALAADGHKWMLGPEGAGIFWIRPNWLDRLHPINVGWNSVVSALDFGTIDFRLKPHAGRYEGGTYNVGGIVGLGESVGQLLKVGTSAVAERIIELTDYLCEKALQVGLEHFSSRAEGEKSGIVSLSKPGVSSFALKQRCLEAGVVVNVRGGRLRISPHCYNTSEEIDRFIDCVR
jgi:selenocysteine lyase/cysteine desulfurase